MRKNKSGFTIVELMIVIVVIAILASIILVSYQNTQARARDTRRKADLASIAEAIQLYRQKCGNDVQGSSTVSDCGNNGSGGSGCGSGGGGNGYFNYDYGSGSGNPKPILACLQTAGFLDGGGTYVDPSGCTTYSGSFAGSTGPCVALNGVKEAYMKYSYGALPNQISCVYAHLETEDDTAMLMDSSANNPCYTATSTSSSYVATNYKMNYMVVVK